jgi:hypothetical protein
MHGSFDNGDGKAGCDGLFVGVQPRPPLHPASVVVRDPGSDDELDFLGGPPQARHP